MVSGFTKFKERFQGFENQYVIIGGTACDLIMENEELPFRATKDVDIVLIVESITAEFGRQFWEYVKEAGYEHLNKSTGNTQFYRFTSPKSKEYPYMIEIFSRNPDFIILEDDAVLTPLPIDDEISSLSAILLNEAYYELLKTGQMMVDGIPVLSLFTPADIPGYETYPTGECRMCKAGQRIDALANSYGLSTFR